MRVSEHVVGGVGEELPQVTLTSPLRVWVRVRVRVRVRAGARGS